MTGGARGLGNAIAVAFAKEGARGVVIVDIQAEILEEGKKAVEAYGTKVGPSWKFEGCWKSNTDGYSRQCLAIQADVTKEADVQKAVDAAVAEFGRIDYAA